MCFADHVSESICPAPRDDWYVERACIADVSQPITQKECAPGEQTSSQRQDLSLVVHLDDEQVRNVEGDAGYASASAQRALLA